MIRKNDIVIVINLTMKWPCLVLEFTCEIFSSEKLNTLKIVILRNSEDSLNFIKNVTCNYWVRRFWKFRATPLHHLNSLLGFYYWKSCKHLENWSSIQIVKGVGCVLFHLFSFKILTLEWMPSVVFINLERRLCQGGKDKVLNSMSNSLLWDFSHQVCLLIWFQDRMLQLLRLQITLWSTCFVLR